MAFHHFGIIPNPLTIHLYVSLSMPESTAIVEMVLVLPTLRNLECLLLFDSLGNMHVCVVDYALWVHNTSLLLFRKTLKSLAYQTIFLKDTNLIKFVQMFGNGPLKIVGNVEINSFISANIPFTVSSSKLTIGS